LLEASSSGEVAEAITDYAATRAMRQRNRHMVDPVTGDARFAAVLSIEFAQCADLPLSQSGF